MSLLVRSWNLFHGNTVPISARGRLEEMVRLAVADRPDVVCLQEVPAWALGHLAGWSGMAVFAEVARRPSLGPLPVPANAGRAVTALRPALFRGFVAGQANATLVAASLQGAAAGVLTLNDRRFRRAQARWLTLPAVARLAWAHERRACHVVRVRVPDGRHAVVANLHATAYPADQRLADAELLRAAVFVDAIARPDEVSVLAGDFNVSAGRSWTLRELTRPEWGYVGGAPGIDHVIVRGAPVGPVARWRDERRRRDGLLLSDHAPVERRIA